MSHLLGEKKYTSGGTEVVVSALEIIAEVRS